MKLKLEPLKSKMRAISSSITVFLITPTKSSERNCWPMLKNKDRLNLKQPATSLLQQLLIPRKALKSKRSKSRRMQRKEKEQKRRLVSRLINGLSIPIQVQSLLTAAQSLRFPLLEKAKNYLNRRYLLTLRTGTHLMSLMESCMNLLLSHAFLESILIISRAFLRSNLFCRVKRTRVRLSQWSNQMCFSLMKGFSTLELWCLLKILKGLFKR